MFSGTLSPHLSLCPSSVHPSVCLSLSPLRSPIDCESPHLQVLSLSLGSPVRSDPHLLSPTRFPHLLLSSHRMVWTHPPADPRADQGDLRTCPQPPDPPSISPQPWLALH